MVHIDKEGVVRYAKTTELGDLIPNDELLEVLQKGWQRACPERYVTQQGSVIRLIRKALTSQAAYTMAQRRRDS